MDATDRAARAREKLSAPRTPCSTPPCVWLRKRDVSGYIMESTASDVEVLDAMLANGWDPL